MSSSTENNNLYFVQVLGADVINIIFQILLYQGEAFVSCVDATVNEDLLSIYNLNLWSCKCKEKLYFIEKLVQRFKKKLRME